MEKFEIFITHPKNENLIIIPFLMDSKKPVEIEKEWNTIHRNIKESLKQIRYYIFNFLPSGIMSKIIYGFYNPKLKNMILNMFPILSWVNSSALPKNTT